jgi:acyl CoA:acetate/3-ketoacid CoA transferase beta subunit
MNQTQAQLVISRATEIQDGLIVILGQGVRVLDCAHYDSDVGSTYEVRTFLVKEEKSDQQGMLNFAEMRQGYQYEDYDLHETAYFWSSKEMYAYIAQEQALYNHF